MKQRGFTVVEGLLIGLIILVVGLGGYYIVDRNNSDEPASTQTEEPTSTFTDGTGDEQTITNFEECMEWVMPTEVVGDEVVCTAPGDVTYTAPCSDVPGVDCTLESEE